MLGKADRIRKHMMEVHHMLVGVYMEPAERDAMLDTIDGIREAVVTRSRQTLPPAMHPREELEVLYRAGIPNGEKMDINNLSEIRQLCVMRQVLLDVHAMLGIKWGEDIYAHIDNLQRKDIYTVVQKFNNEVVGPEVDRTRLGPNTPPENDLFLGIDLLMEEICELLHGCGLVRSMKDGDIHMQDKIDHAKALDGICDVLYVLFGLALRLGYSRELFYEAWREVTRANMDKAGGPIRADGKRLKPDGWRGPDIAGILERYTNSESTANAEI